MFTLSIRYTDRSAIYESPGWAFLVVRRCLQMLIISGFLMLVDSSLSVNVCHWRCSWLSVWLSKAPYAEAPILPHTSRALLHHLVDSARDNAVDPPAHPPSPR